jgi:hypothetical protein
MPGVIRAAAELSVTGGHVWFPWRFAIFAKSVQMYVCSRLAQSSIRVVVERSEPGVIAVVGASTCLCLWSDISL